MVVQGFTYKLLSLTPSTGPSGTAKGCPACHQSGYRGRIGVHELMVMSAELRAMIYKKTIVTQIREAAVRGGMVTLLQDGIQKVVQGATDLNEVRSVCSK